MCFGPGHCDGCRCLACRRGAFGVRCMGWGVWACGDGHDCGEQMPAGCGGAYLIGPPRPPASPSPAQHHHDRHPPNQPTNHSNGSPAVALWACRDGAQRAALVAADPPGHRRELARLGATAARLCEPGVRAWQRFFDVFFPLGWSFWPLNSLSLSVHLPVHCVALRGVGGRVRWGLGR